MAHPSQTTEAYDLEPLICFVRMGRLSIDGWGEMPSRPKRPARLSVGDAHVIFQTLDRFHETRPPAYGGFVRLPVTRCQAQPKPGANRHVSSSKASSAGHQRKSVG